MELLLICLTVLAWSSIPCAHSQSCVHGSLRLVGGSSSLEGRVELCYNGVWGTVCDDLWDSPDALVTCRQLGFRPNGGLARDRAAFGQGSGPILLDNVRCTGSEATLLQCPANPIQSTDCTHSEDAGVTCRANTPPPEPPPTTCSTQEQGDVRLIGGNSDLEGRVELCYNGVWGTVCDDIWGSENAMVVCRQLGFDPTGAIARTNAYFGRGSGPIYLDSVDCEGDETALLQCYAQDIGSHDCFEDHSEDAGVTCLCPHGDVRLADGFSSRDGRVEICYNGLWGTVCDDLWNEQDAQVVCRQLGFDSNGAIAQGNAFFGQGSGRIVIDDTRCLGTEARLIDCTARMGFSDCLHEDDAGVICQEAPTTLATDAPTTLATDAPTTSATDAPTTSATDAPTASATGATTTSATDTPTTSATDALTTSATDAPTTSATDAPTTSATDAPTTSATDATTTLATDAPTTSATDATTTSATDAPTTSATDATTTSATDAPTTLATDAPTTSATDATTTSATDAPTTSATDATTTSATDALTTNAPTTPGIVILQEVRLSPSQGSEPIAGGTYTLECTISHVNTLSPSPLLEVEWLNSDNNPIRASSDFTLSGDTSSQASSLTSLLTFSRLRTSQGGVYTCVSRMSVQNTVYRANMNTSVTVQVPAPNVILSLLDAPISGTTVRLQAVATLSDAVDTAVDTVGTFSRVDSQGLSRFASLSQSTRPPQYITTLSFNPLSEDSGIYVYMVTVTPSDSMYVRGISTSVNYTLTVEPYPALTIEQSLITGDCMTNDAPVTLRGTVTLLPKTALSHSLSYTWTDPMNRQITTSSGDFTLDGNVLQVANVRDNQGDYTLTVCLTVAESNTMTCSSALFAVSNDMPDEATNLACDSFDPSGTSLSITWGLPSQNADSVSYYEVEVSEYYQQEDSRDLLLRPLTPAYTRSVSPNVALVANVSSGIAGSIPYQVSVTPRNAVGCGVSNNLTCFSAEGVPTKAPEEVRVTRPESDPTIIIVTWQRLTLVEAKGPSISYVVSLDIIEKRKRQSTSKIISGDESTTTLKIDPADSHVVSVGTVTPSGDNGPVTVIVVEALDDGRGGQQSGSSGATVGIAVAVTIGALIAIVSLVVAIVIICMYRRKRGNFQLKSDGNKVEMKACEAYGQVSSQTPQKECEVYENNEYSS